MLGREHRRRSAFPVGAQWEEYLALDIAGDQTSEVFIDPLHMGSPAKFAKSTKEVTSA